MNAPPDCSYEFYTIHTDSNTYSDALEGANNFTTYLFTPLKDVVQVSVLLATIGERKTSTENSNVCYLTVDELSSNFNEITGNNVVSTSASGGLGPFITAYPTARANFQNPLAVFFLNDGLSIYKQNDYSTQTQFINPIRRLERLTCKLWDGTGSLLQLNTGERVHITFRFTCRRDNLCPQPSKKKKAIL